MSKYTATARIFSGTVFGREVADVSRQLILRTELGLAPDKKCAQNGMTIEQGCRATKPQLEIHNNFMLLSFKDFIYILDGLISMCFAKGCS